MYTYAYAHTHTRESNTSETHVVSFLSIKFILYFGDVMKFKDRRLKEKMHYIPKVSQRFFLLSNVI